MVNMKKEKEKKQYQIGVVDVEKKCEGEFHRW
jgi:hypothetical protein